MGYAGRPWFHHALRLDAQSGSICLSFAKRWRHSHSDTYPDSNSHCDGNANGYSWSKGYSHAKTAPDTEAASLRRLL